VPLSSRFMFYPSKLMNSDSNNSKPTMNNHVLNNDTCSIKRLLVATSHKNWESIDILTDPIVKQEPMTSTSLIAILQYMKREFKNDIYKLDNGQQCHWKKITHNTIGSLVQITNITKVPLRFGQMLRVIIHPSKCVDCNKILGSSMVTQDPFIMTEHISPINERTDSHYNTNTNANANATDDDDDDNDDDDNDNDDGATPTFNNTTTDTGIGTANSGDFANRDEEKEKKKEKEKEEEEEQDISCGETCITFRYANVLFVLHLHHHSEPFKVKSSEPITLRVTKPSVSYYTTSKWLTDVNTDTNKCHELFWSTAITPEDHTSTFCLENHVSLSYNHICAHIHILILLLSLIIFIFFMLLLYQYIVST